jgi:hypothetical protein
MKGYVKTVLVFIVAIFMFVPQSVLAIGEYNGAWVASFTDGSETWLGFYVIYQESSGSIFINDECFGSIELVKSGSNWVLPASIYSAECEVWVNSYRFTFQNQTYLTGSAEIKENSNTHTLSFSASKQNCETLLSGVCPAGLSGAADSFKCFQVDLLPGTTSLTVTTAYGTGDCDLDVTYYRPPFHSYYSWGDSTDESVYIPSPASGTWYILLSGFESYSGVVLCTTYQEPDTSPIYRFWSDVYGHHFYTISEAEKDHVIATWPDIWRYEGVVFYAYTYQAPGTSPIYRFWSDVYGAHFYTISEAEKDHVIATWPDIWRFEGPVYYAYPSP